MIFSRKKSANTEKYESFDNYWVQKVEINRIENRVEYFKNICEGKNVLHFGCTDWPIFDENDNLHIKLSQFTKSIDGFDIDREGLENLSKFVKGNYYYDYNQLINKKYDVCLVPETIEHVDNVADFLVNLSNIDADKFLITAPNCFSKEHISRNYYGNDSFIEVVHPDHNYWYSPYTLTNVIQKYSKLKVIKVVLMEEEKMVCCEAIKI